MIKYGTQVLIFSAIVWGSLIALIYVNPYSGVIMLSEFVLQLSGSRGEFVLGFSLSELVSFAMRMVPYFIFEAYFGVAFYQHFCTASVYVFSRYPNRIRWYFREIAAVGAGAGLYQILLLGTLILITALRYQIQMDSAGIMLFFYHFLIYFIWFYTMTVLVNLLAVRFGSNRSFFIVFGVQISCIALLGCAGIAERKAGNAKIPINLWLKVNPISHLVLGWQESNINAVNLVLNQHYKGLNLNRSLLLCLLICVVIILLGTIMVSKHDFLISNAEVGEK